MDGQAGQAFAEGPGRPLDEESYYGYKNHLSADKEHKLIRAYAVTDAAVHDSRMFEAVLDRDNTSSEVWADSAYRSRETEGWL